MATSRFFKPLRALLPLLLLLTLCLLQLFPLAPWQSTVQRLDGLLYDSKLRLGALPVKSVANIQIVDIDEQSLAEFGRMPWDRRQFAKLTHALTEQGAILLVFDVLFAEAQKNELADYVAKAPWMAQLASSLQQQIQQQVALLDADQQFAEALATTEGVLATVLHQYPPPELAKSELANSSDKTVISSNKPVVSAVLQRRPEGDLVVPMFAGMAAPTAVLAQAAKGQGFINATEDADGFIRRVALLQQFDKKLVPSLALEAFRVYSLLDEVQPQYGQSNQHFFFTGIQAGNTLISTDQQGRILVPFRGPAKQYPYTSAADILAGRVNDQRFEQAVVFIGTSAAGLVDLRATPTDLAMPGVEIHATVFDSLLSAATIPYRPDWWAGAVVVQLWLFFALFVWWYRRLNAVGQLMAFCVVIALACAINIGLWHYWAIDLPLLSQLLFIVLLAVYYSSGSFIAESQRRAQIKALFDQYVPPAHVERLLSDPAALSLDGEKKQLSVLFCDIRAFSALSENFSAQQLKLWLNQYFNQMTQVILNHGGTIDKYVGDMVMAFWGAPLAQPQHAKLAIQAALAMQDALCELNQQFSLQGQPQVDIGIGIHSGEMNVGDMGSAFRRSYTVIGDAVNVASRLEGLTKYYGVPIIVSAASQALAPEFDYLLLDKVQVKGRQGALELYWPLSQPQAVRLSKIGPLFQQALHAYFAGDFSAAEQSFVAVRTHSEALAPTEQAIMLMLAELFLARVQQLMVTPPTQPWTGCFAHQQK